ncbi:hypothetical protein GCM10020001_069370 [Nonomuraea salmonea]
MPTPSPIIVAMMPACLGMSTTQPSSPITPSPEATLTSAAKIGTMAATSVPNANTSTSSAHTTPMTSLGPVLISLSAGFELSAGTTSSPASRAGSAALDSSWVVWAILSESLPAILIVMRPICRLEEMPPTRNGVSTDVTCGIVSSRSTARSTACLRFSSSSGPSAE